MTNGTGIKDRYELPLTTESPRAADRYVETIDRFLARSTGPTRPSPKQSRQTRVSRSHTPPKPCSRCTL